MANSFEDFGLFNALAAVRPPMIAGAGSAGHLGIMGPGCS